jgi:crotonobetainyl-CoA:carnitine CoA-transferase CaiB-like acyl-CoA transferase
MARRWAAAMAIQDMTGRGVLAGVRVLDFGHYVAGPLAAVMLADQGADVIHIDRPGAEPGDADAFFSRGKRRITLDLKNPADAAAAARLTAQADVLIENFRPGVMARLGLGWEQLREASPGLVYCSLPGFAPEDPRAAVPGWEGVVCAATANCFPRAGQAPPGWDASRPTYTPIPLASNFAAFQAATAVVAALTFRLRTGQGQLVEVPLYHAVFELIGKAGAFVEAEGLPVPQPPGGHGSGVYECADGRYVRFDPIGTSTRFLRWFLDAAGVYSWAAEGLTDGARLSADPELRRKLHESLTELFRTRNAAQWEELVGQSGVPLAFIRTAAEWLHAPHPWLARHVVPVADPVLGTTWMAGLAVHAPGSDGWDPAPRRLPGADTVRTGAESVFAEREHPATQSAPDAEPAASGEGRPGAYSGLHVLDLTEVLAGPTSGRILGEHGAEVVKVNSPRSSVTGHGVVNRGKRSILLDVESERGQAVFWRLAERCDVIIQNYPEGTADRYGIGYQHVRARNPRAVQVFVTCYGDRGLWGNRRGYETQGQAVSGLMDRAGGDHVPGVLGPYNVVDYGTGVLAAFAAALGLYHRAVTGQGCYVSASLAQTATYHQAAYLLDYEGKRYTEPRGPEPLGIGPYQRYYQASDGWFFLGMTASQLGTLRQVPGLEDLPADGRQCGAGPLEEQLAARFAGRSAAEWVPALQRAGLGAHEVLTTERVMTDSRARSLGLSVSQESEEVGKVIVPGLTARLSLSPLRLGEPARQPGADADAVLADIGLTGQAEALAQAWALRTTGLPRGW